jgi:prenyltransferase beta subunit
VATNGIDVWIVDAKVDKVYRYSGAEREGGLRRGANLRLMRLCSRLSTSWRMCWELGALRSGDRAAAATACKTRKGALGGRYNWRLPASGLRRWALGAFVKSMLKTVSRRAVLGGAVVASGAMLPRWGWGQQKPVADGLLTPATQRAIDRGLEWLVKRQIISGREEGAFGHGGYAGGVAVSSLAGLAFMMSGSPPGQGPFGRPIDRCIRYISSCVNESGYISPPAGGQDNMYGHGFAMLFLSQAYGMADRPEADAAVGEKLRKAVRLTCQCQNDAGGWRYQPQKDDADLSITICQIMGLRAARDAGIHVPDEVRTRCIEYVKKSQNADGGFRYQISGGSSTFPLTAAGIVSLYSAGIYEGEPIEKGLAWLMKRLPGGTPSEGGYFYYGHYYAVQAMWHAGGDHWAKWYPAIRDVLLARQTSDGLFPDAEVCPEFGTAMATIILQMPNNFLPIFAP